MIKNSIINNTQKTAKSDLKIAMLMFVILIASSIAGQNFINLFDHNIATGMLIFPINFILVALITELYGFRYARSIILFAAFCNMILASIIILFTKIPSSSAYIGDALVYHKFCERLAHLIFISTCAYIISEYTNAWIISNLSRIFSGKFLLWRAFLSISIGVTVDTWLFFPIVLSRQNSTSAAAMETFFDMFVKIGYEMLLLPLFWILIEYSKYRKQNTSYFDNLPESALPYSSVHYLKLELGSLE